MPTTSRSGTTASTAPSTTSVARGRATPQATSVDPTIAWENTEGTTQNPWTASMARGTLTRRDGRWPAEKQAGRQIATSSAPPGSGLL